MKDLHRHFQADQIIKWVCDKFDLKPEQLSEPFRKDRVAYPRMIAMYLLKQRTTLSLTDIGRMFNRSGAGTAYKACKAIENPKGNKKLIAAMKKAILS